MLNYGPVNAFWCFPFERYNEVLGSFQNNWMLPELQMLKKFTTHSIFFCFKLILVPNEISEFFQFQLGQQKLHVVSEGSVEETHIYALSLLEYKKNRVY